MGTELLAQAMKLFDTLDKWNAYLELVKAKEEIKKGYFSRLRKEIVRKEYSDSSRGNTFWSLIDDEFERCICFLTEFGKDSIGLVWDSKSFTLWGHPNTCDVNKANDLLATSEFEPIKSCFDTKHLSPQTYKEHFFKQKHKFEFSDGQAYSAYDSESHDILSWFAGNKTEEMARLIIDQVNKFRTPEITKLLIELNTKCRNNQK